MQLALDKGMLTPSAGSLRDGAIPRASCVTMKRVQMANWWDAVANPAAVESLYSVVP